MQDKSSRTQLVLGIAALGLSLMSPVAVQAASHAGGAPMAASSAAPMAKTADRMGSSDRAHMKDWTNDKDMLQKDLKLGESKAYYNKALADRGYQITSVNTDKPSEVEYEVVKNGHSYEVQFDFDKAGKASKIDVSTNMWRTAATKAAMAGGTVAGTTAYVKGNEAYSDRMRMKTWNGEKDRLQKTLATGHDKAWYAAELKKLGYQVTSVNENEKDYLEYEIVKGEDTYEVQIDMANNMGKKVDVTTNVWQAEATEKALGQTKR